MPSDFFLNLVDTKTGPVKGESVDAGYPDEIQVSKFTIEVTGPQLDSAGSADAGACTLHEAEFEMPVSVASTALFYLCCSGEMLKQATLTCRKAGGKMQAFLQWRFHKAQVSYYKVTAGDEPTETIKIRYAKAEVAYSRQKPDGSLEATPRTAGWDADQNASLKASLPHPPKNK
jgi:type VI secretion system secreted protein Hcp